MKYKGPTIRGLDMLLFNFEFGSISFELVQISLNWFVLINCLKRAFTCGVWFKKWIMEILGGYKEI